MSQTNRGRAGSQPQHRARRLTPEQRRRILEKRRRQRRRKQLMVAIPAALLLLVVAVVGVRFALGGRGSDAVAAQPDSLATEAPGGLIDSGAVGAGDTLADALEVSAGEPTVVEATATAAPTPTQDPAEYVTYNPPGGVFVFDDAYVAAALGEVTGPELHADLSAVDPDLAYRWPEVEEGLIPILYKGNDVQEKIIAITVDDCYQAGNLRQIVQSALSSGGKVTVFPIGENLAKDSVAEAVKWAWEQGMEIENHSYKHLGTYHYDDDYMTRDIWEQSYALNQVLGVNYKQHFFRPKGGDEYKDQRTHAYVSQLGMYGLALWNVTGSQKSFAKLTESLKPGAVFLFHTTDSDCQNLQQFIPYAVQQGYRLVTLNEMFGLPENETSDLSTAQTEKPDIEPFKIIPAMVKKNSYMRAAAVVQQRLIDLGYLNGKADGVFGNSSYKATGYFQKAAGIKADGIAGKDTQAVLFSDEAPKKK